MGFFKFLISTNLDSPIKIRICFLPNSRVNRLEIVRPIFLVALPRNFPQIYAIVCSATFHVKVPRIGKNSDDSIWANFYFAISGGFTGLSAACLPPKNWESLVLYLFAACCQKIDPKYQFS
jgi:hypothetical protein